MNHEYESPRGDSKPMPDRGISSGMVENTAMGEASMASLQDGFCCRKSIVGDTKSDAEDFA